MNKYQKNLLDRSCFWFCIPSELQNLKREQAIHIDTESDTITLKQYEDITISKYWLALGKIAAGASAIEKVFVSTEEGWDEIICESIEQPKAFGNSFGEGQYGSFLIPISFENKIKKIRLVFKNNIADDYEFEVKYIDADKDLYYQKRAEVKRANYIESAQIKHSTGSDLVNIYFQPCCSDCGKTEIELWIAKGKRENHHGMVAYVPRLIGAEPEQMIAKFSVDEGFLFKSISGLANGVYVYRLRQYNKNNELLFETDYYFFEISSQSSGRPMGRINR
jgi:hypothetical protein